MSFDRLWAEIDGIGRHGATGGYRRFAWTHEDAELREWFAGAAADRGLEVVVDRAGNQWAWSGDPDAAPGVVLGSHLDSVPDGGAFDGPLGVVSAFAALDEARARGVSFARPVGVVQFADEEGARFGVACAGSRLLTGVLAPQRALSLVDGDGTTLGEAMRSAGRVLDEVGRDDKTMRRVGCFVELHVEQGRGLVDLGAAIGIGTLIRPHGRWRFEIAGRADHAGTTQLADRHDAMLGFAAAVLLARQLAERHGVLATVGKVRAVPNGVNAIASGVVGWLDARGDDASAVQALVADFAAGIDGTVHEESWTHATRFDAALAERVAGLLGGPPRLPTGAGHDAGVGAPAGGAPARVFVPHPPRLSPTPPPWGAPDPRAGR
ncbi:MAG: allantoate amidohydrolase, partial [Jatrophihabitans sp.]|uniref:allantoate amidohydrolase n=1 Tax=Jatrophihabitans sp. TaxID=1932789 RepID=UPI003F8154C7